MATTPDSVAYAQQYYGILGPLVPGWINVQDYGADPTGNNVASEWLQAAANAVPDDGGVLLIPPGIYKCNTPVFLKSNTKIVAHGATLKATMPWYRVSPADSPSFWSSSYWFFTNVNYNELTITDENIEVWGCTFDYTDLTESPGGGRHAVTMRRVRNVKVVGCTSFDGDDQTAFLGCDDTLVLGCSAYDFTNAAYDHWAGCKNARVIGCYTRSSRTVQHANFNALGDGISNQVFDGGIIEGCTFENPVVDGNEYASVFLDPLGTGHTTKNIVIKGNIFKNVIVVGRGNVQNVIIQGNQFIGTPGAPGISPILFYTDGVDTPDGITIDNNAFIEPQSAAPNVAVIDVRATNPRVTNNRITGAGYSVPGFLMPVASNGIDFGNVVSSGNYGGNNTVSSGNRIKAPFNEGLSFKTSQDNVYNRFYVDVDDNLVLRTVDSGGGLRNVFGVPSISDVEPFVFYIEMRTDMAHLRKVETGLTATGVGRTTALALTAQFNDVTTVAAGTGVRLYNRQNGEIIVRVRNGGANALNVYPHNGTDQIDALGAGNPYVLGVGEIGAWCLTLAGQWYTVGVYP